MGRTVSTLSALELQLEVQKSVSVSAIMNFKLVVASCLIAAACGQQINLVEPAAARILKEQRFNTGDGRFGSAFAQEDGVVYREETTADGERIGQYSYIDLDGKTISVKYTAGKDGFRIIEGDHVPTGANGQNSAAFDPTQAAASVAPVAPQQPAPFRPAPVQQAVPQQAFPVRQAPAPLPVSQFLDYDYVDETPVDPNRNPFINPHDPTHRNLQFNVNGANFAPANGIRSNQFHSASAVPNCANCAGVNPFINPFDASHQQGFAPAAPVQQARFAAPAQQFNPAFTQQAQPTFAQQPQQAFAQQTFTQQPQQSFNLVPTTEAPRHFFPPGQLQLNRFENGFNFDFSS